MAREGLWPLEASRRAWCVCQTWGAGPGGRVPLPVRTAPLTAFPSPLACWQRCCHPHCQGARVGASSQPPASPGLGAGSAPLPALLAQVFISHPSRDPGGGVQPGQDMVLPESPPCPAQARRWMELGAQRRFCPECPCPGPPLMPGPAPARFGCPLVTRASSHHGSDGRLCHGLCPTAR